jgi:hypothetical protein
MSGTICWVLERCLALSLALKPQDPSFVFEDCHLKKLTPKPLFSSPAFRRQLARNKLHAAQKHRRH